ncbi:uncharacterized protein [Macrobrachium rosenbergii]|uniref:uncharacterized protein n=1 Tax=Macrobrachium rosenbergii TaxID=79674 RepID=UPI0034D68F3A
MNASEDDVETDMTDNDDELGPDMSESEDDLEVDVSDSEDNFETEMNDVDYDSETEMSLVSRLEDSLEMEDSETDLDTDMSHPRPGDQPDMEQQKLQEALETSQVYGNKMEHLWKEAMDKIVSLQNQLLDKDMLLEKNADEAVEMKREIENVYLQKEQVVTDKRRLEDRNRELEENLAKETRKNLTLEDQVQSLEKVLCQKEDRLVSATEILNAERAKAEILRAELQAMKSWVSQLGGQNAKINES